MFDKRFAVLWVFLLSLSAAPAMATQSCNTTVTQTAQNGRYVDPGASQAQCWGSNTNGQLGNGTATDSRTPVNVTGIRTAKALGAGQDHSCSLLVDGTVQCWGWNAYGQLGNNSTTDSFTPVTVFKTVSPTVSALTNVASLAVGRDHSCARLANGTVWCWGLNSDGQLGNGNTVDSPIPVPVTGITTAIAVTAGDYHSCAVQADGSVWCWGRNDNGQLGNNSIIAAWTPAQVSGISTATVIAAGGSHSCARLDDGRVECWGLNSSGQLGDGTFKESHMPVFVSGLATATAIAVGNAHSCARLSDNKVWCWGQNNYGQLGNDSTDNVSTPVNVSGIDDAVDVVASGDHSCALLSVLNSDGKIECWGLNADGQLGNGSPRNSSVPVFVRSSGLGAITKATAVAAGAAHSCARLSKGTGTLIDTSTGLMWKRCSEGQTWDIVDEVCKGPNGTSLALPLTWKDALQRAHDVNRPKVDPLKVGEDLGYSDWRLPNRNELASLVEHQCSSPAINAAVFPSTVAAPYWSSSPNAGNAQQAWSVDFNDGRVNGVAKTGSAYARLVRGGH
jgi:alpha-tubulin suppressor-like RCC1 family protein